MKKATQPHLGTIWANSNLLNFFGESWGNKVFTVSDDGGFFGVRTHAWGTFLAACRITFKDKSKSAVTLYRYIDFSMAEAE